MKKLLMTLALALCASPLLAGSNVPYTFVTVATFTATNGANVFAFQNTDSNLDVYVQSIEVANALDQSALTGGPAQYLVYGSTVLTHGGTGQIRTFSLTSANASQPSYISASTGAVSVSYENLSGGTSLPLIRPLIVNTDEAATTLLSDSYVENGGDKASIKLPHGANRALVVTQAKFAAAAMDTGKIQLTIKYTVK